MATGTMHTTADPIAAILDFEGSSADDYERLSERMRPNCRHRRLQGCIYHWMKHYPDGFRLIQFWLGRDGFERFLIDELRPVVRELGLVEPRLTIEAVPPDALFGSDEHAPEAPEC
jgi:hypothetical protein